MKSAVITDILYPVTVWRHTNRSLSWVFINSTIYEYRVSRLALISSCKTLHCCPVVSAVTLKATVDITEQLSSLMVERYCFCSPFQHSTQLLAWSGICYSSLYSVWTASVVQWSEFLATDPEVQIRFPALPDFLSSGSWTGPTQPREYNWVATWKKVTAPV
jgi:hypothetical protein